MKYPYVNYIRALVLKGQSNSMIRGRISSFRMVTPDADFIDDIRNSMFEKLPKKALKKIESNVEYDFPGFLKEAGDSIDSLDLNDIIPVLSGIRVRAWEEALIVMVDSEFRLFTIGMAIYGADPDKIREDLRQNYNVDLSEKGLNFFLKYFWNIKDFSRLDLYNFIMAYPSANQKKLLLDSFHKKEAAIKWRLTGENVLTLEKVLESVLNESFAKFKDSVSSEDVENASKTQQWANLAIRAAEKLQDITSNQSPAALASIEFRLKQISQDDIATVESIEGDVL